MSLLEVRSGLQIGGLVTSERIKEILTAARIVANAGRTDLAESLRAWAQELREARALGEKRPLTCPMSEIWIG